ncbi:MAG: hypothetical protein K2L19_02190, partial [Eubacterium sp.]|nr:hypothetical protein [Eubacterium sp.]
MKKGSKKIFALLLSAIMLVTSIPLGTFIATAADSTYSLKDLETLMTKFEQIISDGTVYTNAGNAYEAYVQCQKAYDAYEYGANKDVDISGAAAALDGAMLSMDKWEIPTPVANPIPSFDGGTVPESAYANILCSNRRNAFASADFTFITNQWKTWGVTYTCRTNVQIGYNETVMFYDGITQPKMPVMAFTDYQNAVGGKRDHYLYSCYPDTTDLYLADQWHSDGGAAWNFSDRYNGTSRVGHDANTFVSGPNLRDENWHGYSNILLFNTNISWENTYYKTYKNLSWTAYAGESSTPNKDHVGSDAVNDNSTIYVINYSPLREKIVNYPKSVPNVSNYREGGLADLFEAYNIATAVNPNDYDYSSDTAQAVEACADSIKKAVEAADKATAGDTDSEAYKNLRQAITDNAAVDKADGCPGAKSEYESALAAARSAMSAVYT